LKHNKNAERFSMKIDSLEYVIRGMEEDLFNCDMALKFSEQ
jgi:hypothetical protein